MPKYPLWIRIEYLDYDMQIGYTGCVCTRADLLDVIIRLDIYQSNIKYFEINGEAQLNHVLVTLYQEAEKVRKERGHDMKQGKRPTNRQKEAIEAAGLKASNWLVVKNLQHENELHIVNRSSNKTRVIRYE